MADIRSPICVFLGHVDHGKTTIQDFIRSSSVAKGEPGAITQHIGCSIIPLETIKEVCGDLLKSLKIDFTIPGILMVDSPGHAAFTNLRKRGGNLADVAVLVIYINEGVMPQTKESIEILKQYKTPFIVALNKIDLINGWQKKEGNILQKLANQGENVRNNLDRKLYEVVGKLAEFGFNSERFDRVDDYTKQIAIVPVSGKTGEGIPELLMVLIGLAQKFLEKCLSCDVKGYAKGTILEVKEDKGLGKTLDAIIYNGSLKKNDIIVIGGLEKPIVSRVRALLQPLPLTEMRDKKGKFKTVDEVKAATGVKISAPDVDQAVAGMPIRGCDEKDLEKVKEEIQKEVEEVLIETDKEGIIIKADSLGSLEALIKLLREKKIKIRSIGIGNIQKKDIYDAESNYEKNPFESAVLGFNVADESGICLDKVKCITNNIIYKLIEDFEKWQIEEKKKMEIKELEFLIRPCKMQILRGYVFRQNNPAVVGVVIEAGAIKPDTPVMKKDGNKLTVVKSIQAEQKNVDKAERGKQVAISLPDVTVGRQIHEGDILYSAVPESDFRKFKEFKQYLKEEEIEVLKEIAVIMRKNNPIWGI